VLYIHQIFLFHSELMMRLTHSAYATCDLGMESVLGSSPFRYKIVTVCVCAYAYAISPMYRLYCSISWHNGSLRITHSLILASSRETGRHRMIIADSVMVMRHWARYNCHCRAEFHVTDEVQLEPDFQGSSPKIPWVWNSRFSGLRLVCKSIRDQCIVVCTVNPTCNGIPNILNIDDVLLGFGAV
jgi:hypothetical protein